MRRRLWDFSATSGRGRAVPGCLRATEDGVHGGAATCARAGQDGEPSSTQARRSPPVCPCPASGTGSTRLTTRWRRTAPIIRTISRSGPHRPPPGALPHTRHGRPCSLSTTAKDEHKLAPTSRLPMPYGHVDPSPEQDQSPVHPPHNPDYRDGVVDERDDVFGGCRGGTGGSARWFPVNRLMWAAVL